MCVNSRSTANLQGAQWG